MDIRILFDNKKRDGRYMAGWGVSYLVGDTLLFDTGESGHMLLHNMGVMGVTPAQITKAVISHEHWDHTGGLWHLLKENGGITVYGCVHFSRDFKTKVRSLGAEFVAVESFTEIDGNVLTTGEITGAFPYDGIPEQSLVIRSEKGATVITGCAHGGIVNILASVRDRIPGLAIHLAIGGFHMLDSSPALIQSMVRKFRRFGVENVAPAHCTGDEAQRLFREAYGDNYAEVAVGQTFRV